MIMSFVNQKGGVAKTTLTLNLGYIFSEKKKVLLIDLDPQGSLSISLGIESDAMYQIICKSKKAEEFLVKIKDNLFLLPTDISLSVAELNLVTEMARENVLKRALNKIKDDFDYIFIDCPPSLGLLVINSLNASDKVIIPCATDYLSYRGLKLLLDTLDKVTNNLNPDLKVEGVVATFVDTRTLHSKEILEELKKEYNVLGTVSSSVKVKDSILAKKSLVEFDPGHKIVQEFKEIAEVILENEQKNRISR